MRQRMGGTEILLKRHCSHRRCDEHFSARVEIVSIAIGARQRIDDHMNSLERDAVTKRMEHR